MRLPPEFDLHAIEVFVLSVELGGMTATAQQLGVTQSAVSQTITRLEHALGTPLFDRALRPLGLTPAGRALYERAKDLLARARLIVDEVREGASQPIDQITIEMSESFATLLTGPILARFGERVERWHVRSGTSLKQQKEFLARRCDMLITGSNTLERHPGIEHVNVLDDPFVMIFPPGWTGPIEPTQVTERLPFVRYAQDQGMGQRIESQLTRMKLRLPQVIEIESIHQQLTTVALGIGWSITSLLCLATMPSIIGQLRVEPMSRGAFARRVQVVARIGELADLPGRLAEMARDVMRDESLPPVYQVLPWTENLVCWP